MRAHLADWRAALRGEALTRRKPRQPSASALRRELGLLDLLAYGVGSTVGGGIYSLVATGALLAGPGMTISFLVCAVACALTALVYAEFVSRVPDAGSAYSFSYGVFGEFVAWTLGWSITLEYAIASAGTARSFGSYTVDIFSSFNVTVPSQLNEWQAGPLVLSPLSSMLVIALTLLLLSGVRFSSIVNIVITITNVSALLFFIIAGAIKVDPSNWNYEGRGFVPSQNGIFAASTVLFFSYLGFDQVSALAEEARNPRRNLPLGIIGSLVIVSILYISVALVATGMVPWTLLGQSKAPLSLCFTYHGWNWAAHIVQFGSLFAGMGGVYSGLLGQPRIFYRIASDGLFFPLFAKVNPKTGVPMLGTLLIGGLTAIIAFLSSLEFTASVVSVGILFAFTTVDCGLLVVRYGDGSEGVTMGKRTRRAVVLVLAYVVLLIAASVMLTWNSGATNSNINVHDPLVQAALVLFGLSVVPVIIFAFLPQNAVPGGGFRVPLVPFVPAGGIGVNILMATSHLSAKSWIAFGVWFVIGTLIYFFYGVQHSKLRKDRTPGPEYQALQSDIQ